MATAMTLASVVVTQMGNLFAQRTESISVFRMRWGRNRLVWVGMATELALLALLLYVPVLQRLFDTAPLPLHNWLFLFAWMPILLIADEGRKALVRRRARGRLHSRVRASA
jgi:magnesium-transporting ATPase (P-type)